MRMNIRLIDRDFLIPAEKADEAMLHFRPEDMKPVEGVLQITCQLDRYAGLSESEAVPGDQQLGPQRFHRSHLIPGRKVGEKKDLDALGLGHLWPWVYEYAELRLAPWASVGP